jgi:D-alanyl-D-alanine endopeptidase (penicillin-binding protein 7)
MECMKVSYRIKRLIVIALLVIIVAFAANEGMKDPYVKQRPAPPRTLYPNIPKDIDPNIVDPNLDSANTATTPKPVVNKPSPSPKPEVSAQAYLVANLDTGEIYSQFNADRIYPIASLSKLVTALVALHSIEPDRQMTVTESMLETGYGEAGHLVAGEKFTVSELLYPMLLESSNDAAQVFAENYGYNAFILKMNGFARSLNMNSTSFKDPSGLSSGNSSTARDLFTLAQNLYRTEESLLKMTRQLAYSVSTTTDHGAHLWKTINPFPLDPHFIGGKTGRTNEAKESMVSLFRYEHDGVTYPVAIIVLRSDFSVREIDSAVLFEKFIHKIEAN